jgi:uncharacterized protein (TIGR02646 family)
MIQLPHVELHADALAALRRYQAEVDAVDDFAARVQRAVESFSSRNRPEQKTFAAVKAALAKMCCGARRCAYCEDSAADEVEHIRPKSRYPEAVFVWPNYLYACGPCNGAKNNRFAVFPGEHLPKVEVANSEGPPVAGTPVFLNPRDENAMQWITLDLRTCLFVATAPKSTQAHERTCYTIEVLGLNRDLLIDARKAALKDYRAHLAHYVQAKTDDATADALDDIRTTITCRQHPTVWREMQRQHDKHDFLRPLFAAAPEAINW